MKIFTSTLYRIPTDQELKKFEQFPTMTSKEVLSEFQYIIIGKGILNEKHKHTIIECISKLIKLYPENKAYKEALELASKLSRHQIKEAKALLKELPPSVYGLVNSVLDSYVDQGVKVPDFLDYLNRIEENFDYILAKIQFKADLINMELPEGDIKEALKDSVRDRIAFLNDIIS